jgi:hypothetical protein
MTLNEPSTHLRQTSVWSLSFWPSCRSSAFGDAMKQNITPVAQSEIAQGYLEWSPIVLGAFAAAALSSVFWGSASQSA